MVERPWIEGAEADSNVVHVDFSPGQRRRVDRVPEAEYGAWEDRLKFLERLNRFGLSGEETAFMAAMESPQAFKTQAFFFERVCDELAAVMPEEQVGDLMRTPSRILRKGLRSRSPLEAMMVKPDYVSISAWASLQIETRKNA